MKYVFVINNLLDYPFFILDLPLWESEKMSNVVTSKKVIDKFDSIPRHFDILSLELLADRYFITEILLNYWNICMRLCMYSYVLYVCIYVLYVCKNCIYMI